MSAGGESATADVTIDRQEALRRAEALLKQGQFDAAIDEYAALVAANPADWSSLNILGDLHVRAGHPHVAIPLYAQVADHYLVEGFHARAAGFYKKILKFTPHDEDVRLKLSRACAQQGLLLDARHHLQDVVAARRSRGDSAGAAAALALIAALDERPPDSPAQPGGTVVARDPEPAREEPGVDQEDPDAEPAGFPGRVVAIEVDLTDFVDALAQAPPSAAANPAREGGPPAPATSLESTFAALRQQASPGAEDLVALGRTYAAAGMQDEAVEALETAAHDPSQQYEAAVAMVDICAARRDHAGVIDWLERATEAAPTAAKRGAALYRLGLALEQAGEMARALAIWLELQALAPAFRDVGARVSRLQQARNGGAPSGS